jgi:hypothetical protein
MRRWIALIGVVAALAVAGTALALTGPDETPATEDKEVSSVYEAPEIITIKADKIPEDEPLDQPKETAPTEEDKETETPDELADTIPPALAILHPVDGQVFEKKEVVFEGTTEPGARVFAGKYEADVKDDGSWRIVLYLSPGDNRATFKAMDAAGNVATASVSMTYLAPEKDEPKEGEDKPKDGEEADWKFEAHQQFGVCSETPPYDVFHGTGKPGTAIYVKSEFGNGVAEVNDDGQWELKVFFETAPVGLTFPVKVKDEFGNYQVFEFTHID